MSILFGYSVFKKKQNFFHKDSATLYEICCEIIVLVMNEKNLVGEHINRNVDINKILVEIAGQSTLGELGR